MKKTYTYKLGRRKHSSLMSIEKFTFGDSPTQSEFDELDNALKDEPETDEEALNLLYKFVCSVMEDKAKELGIKEGTEINHKNSIEHGPVFFSGSNALYWMKQALRAKQQDDYKDAFTHLLHAIPALLKVQLLANESIILAGNNRLSNSQNEAILRKNKYKNLAEPIYKGYLKTHKPTDASRLTARQLNKEYSTSYSHETIRDWFKPSKKA